MNNWFEYRVQSGQKKKKIVNYIKGFCDIVFEYLKMEKVTPCH